VPDRYAEELERVHGGLFKTTLLVERKVPPGCNSEGIYPMDSIVFMPE
jgi:hypothetical protein